MRYCGLKVGSHRQIRTCLTIVALSSTSSFLALLLILISSQSSMVTITDQQYVQHQGGQGSLPTHWTQNAENFCPHTRRPELEHVLRRNKYWQYAKREQSSEVSADLMTSESLREDRNLHNSGTQTADFLQDLSTISKAGGKIHGIVDEVKYMKSMERVIQGRRESEGRAEGQGQKDEQVRFLNEGEIVVYSAFYDSRSLAGDTHSIRILGLLSNRTVWDIYCHVWYPEYVTPYVTRATHHVTGRTKGYRLGMPITNISHVQVQFTCPMNDAALSNQKRFPSHVSLVTSRCARASIYLAVQMGTRQPMRLDNTAEISLRFLQTNRTEAIQYVRRNANHKADYGVLRWLTEFFQGTINSGSAGQPSVGIHHDASEATTSGADDSEKWNSDEIMDFIICVPISFGYVDVAEFAEWMEFYRLMGVSEIHVYESWMSNMTSAFNYFQSNGLLHLHHIPPPVEVSLSQLSSTDPVKVASAVSLNDCMMTNAYRSRYILVVDFDELIIPRIHRDFREVLLAVESNRTSSVEGDKKDGQGPVEPFEQYSMSNVYYFREYGSVTDKPDGDSDELFSVKYRKRAPSMDISVAPKSFVDPRTCLSVFNHYCYMKLGSRAGNKVSRFEVSTKLVTVHHYRRCGFKPKVCRAILSTNEIDDTALRFVHELRPRVRQALNVIKASEL